MITSPATEFSVLRKRKFPPHLANHPPNQRRRCAFRIPTSLSGRGTTWPSVETLGRKARAAQTAHGAFPATLTRPGFNVARVFRPEAFDFRRWSASNNPHGCDPQGSDRVDLQWDGKQLIVHIHYDNGGKKMLWHERFFGITPHPSPKPPIPAKQPPITQRIRCRT
jgi:hypothetical protein